MTGDAWSERRKALEESFYQRHNRQLLDNLRQKLASEERKKALSSASGITDDDVLEQLVNADVSCETVAALALVPVIAVAWADGEIAEQERTAILQASESEGLKPGSVSYELIESWLAEQPQPALMTAWKAYIAGLLEQLSDNSVAQIRAAIMGRARRVAKSAGGILGLKRISPSEQAVLDELDAALSP